MDTITIRYQVFNAKWQLVTKEKTFRSEEALQKWVEKQERDNPNWNGVVAYEYKS